MRKILLRHKDVSECTFAKLPMGANDGVGFTVASARAPSTPAGRAAILATNTRHGRYKNWREKQAKERYYRGGIKRVMRGAREAGLLLQFLLCGLAGPLSQALGLETSLDFFGYTMVKVLISGASGFIAGHCIIEMLNHGYDVRGTLRDAARGEALKVWGEKAYTDIVSTPYEFVSADLMNEASWVEAAHGCDSVLHVASPVPVVQPDDENDVIIPAKAGTLNVLKAATANGIKRVVITSSVAAVMSGSQDGGIFTDKDWTDLTRTDLSPYVKSKTLAERAAWDYAQANDLELVAVNPALVLGPALEADYEVPWKPSTY